MTACTTSGVVFLKQHHQVRCALRSRQLQNTNCTSLRTQKRREKQLLAGGHAPHQHLTKYELCCTNIYRTSLSKREARLQRVVEETTSITALLRKLWHATTLWTTQW